MSEAGKRTAFIAEIDCDELACRIAEAALGLKRPPGIPARRILNDMQRQTKAIGSPDVAPGFRRAAQAAAEYLTECVQSGKVPS